MLADFDAVEEDLVGLVDYITILLVGCEKLNEELSGVVIDVNKLLVVVFLHEVFDCEHELVHVEEHHFCNRHHS